jgi:hypothetical protein
VVRNQIIWKHSLQWLGSKIKDVVNLYSAQLYQQAEKLLQVTFAYPTDRYFFTNLRLQDIDQMPFFQGIIRAHSTIAKSLTFY